MRKLLRILRPKRFPSAQSPLGLAIEVLKIGTSDGQESRYFGFDKQEKLSTERSGDLAQRIADVIRWS